MVVGDTSNKQGEIFHVPENESNLHHAERDRQRLPSHSTTDLVLRSATATRRLLPLRFPTSLSSFAASEYATPLFLRLNHQVLPGNVIVAVASHSSAGRITLPPRLIRTVIDRDGFLRCAWPGAS
jgi:hypothetical protein